MSLAETNGTSRGSSPSIFDMEPVGGVGGVFPSAMDNIYSQYGVAPGSGSRASELSAAITRAEWDDWQERFKPIENELIASIGDEEIMSSAISRGQASVGQGFKSANEQTTRSLGRYGVVASEAQKSANKRSMNLGEAATKARVTNKTREAITQRDMNIMAGTGGG